MRVSVLTSDNFKPTNWSGGTTTELYIFPNGANFSNRDFGFRLSTATVELESSDFTPLPGFHRDLLILEGAMSLTFNGESTQELAKFDVATFEGDWKTTSKGICSDFNVMTNDDFEADVFGVTLTKSELTHVELEDQAHWLFIYNLSRPITIIVGSKNFTIGAMELLIIEEVDFDEFSLHSDEDAECVITCISELED